jgi:pyruvate/2-oxoglutarate dehydrogenase complex dihydrolipoamide dehydrogenase (E3) component
MSLEFTLSGDIKGGLQFTHISYHDFRIIRNNLLSSTASAKLGTKDRLVPYTVFMDPQLGRIGLTETETRERHSSTGGEPKNIRVAKMPMAWVARALELDESRGMMKAIVDHDSKQPLGFDAWGLRAEK